LPTRRVVHCLKAHKASVGELAFSPDARLVASGSQDGTIAIWDANRGTMVRAFLGHSRLQSGIQFSPDGKILAAGNDQGVVRLWDVADGHELDPLPGHSGAVHCLAFSPDGEFFASGAEDRNVYLHDLVRGVEKKLSMPSAVTHIAFSPDGRTLAAVGDSPGAGVHLWDIETGKETIWRAHDGNIHCVAFSPAQSFLATGSEDGTVKLWDLSALDHPSRTIGPGPFGGPVRSVAFTPDGRYLATANANGFVYLLETGRALRVP
jgi:WD40 repeat protein